MKRPAGGKTSAHLPLRSIVRGGGRQGGAQYQYAMIAPDVTELRDWALKLEDRMKEIPGLEDVTSDQDRAGPQVDVFLGVPIGCVHEGRIA